MPPVAPLDALAERPVAQRLHAFSALGDRLSLAALCSRVRTAQLHAASAAPVDYVLGSRMFAQREPLSGAAVEHLLGVLERYHGAALRVGISSGGQGTFTVGFDGSSMLPMDGFMLAEPLASKMRRMDGFRLAEPLASKMRRVPVLLEIRLLQPPGPSFGGPDGAATKLFELLDSFQNARQLSIACLSADWPTAAELRAHFASRAHPLEIRAEPQRLGTLDLHSDLHSAFRLVPAAAERHARLTFFDLGPAFNLGTGEPGELVAALTAHPGLHTLRCRPGAVPQAQSRRAAIALMETATLPALRAFELDPVSMTSANVVMEFLTRHSATLQALQLDGSLEGCEALELPRLRSLTLMTIPEPNVGEEKAAREAAAQSRLVASHAQTLERLSITAPLDWCEHLGDSWAGFRCLRSLALALLLALVGGAPLAFARISLSDPNPSVVRTLTSLPSMRALEISITHGFGGFAGSNAPGRTLGVEDGELCGWDVVDGMFSVQLTRGLPLTKATRRW